MKIFPFLVLAGILFFSCDNDDNNGTQQSMIDSVEMGAGYANDIYVDLSEGTATSVSRLNWDVAFMTNPMTSTILINEGAGVKLYSYPNADTSGWDAVDTTGLSGWAPMYNTDTSWFYGAFDIYAKGHPDYGWGVYNSATHSVTGDSIFIIQLTDKSFRKLKVVQRRPTDNTFVLMIENLNSQKSSASIVEVPCTPYQDKNFIYYSIVDDMTIDREPAKENWDLVFTQYHNEAIDYTVSGVLTNDGVEVAQVDDMNVDIATSADGIFSTSISEIGSDWKSFDMSTYTYKTVEDRSYFVKTSDGSIYKMVFTGATGSSSGIFKFNITKE